MKEENNFGLNKSILRKKAEELLKLKSLHAGMMHAEVDTLKLIHELEVHEVELELQNTELINAICEAQDAIQLYDFAPAGFFTLSIEGEILNLNLRGAQMLHEERLNLKNRHFGLFVSDGTKTIFNHFLYRIFDSLSKESCELTLIIDGQPLSVHLNGIVSESGEQCLITAIDLKERNEIEQALKESEIKYRMLIENSPDAIAIYAKGNIVLVNKECLRLMHAKSEFDLLGRSVIEFVHPDYRKLVAERMSQVVSDGEPLPPLEEKFIRLDGSVVDIEAKSMPILFENKPAVQLIVRDITDRKQAEESLRNSEAKYKELFQNSGTNILIIDREGKYLMVNEQVASQMGYLSKEIIGKTMSDFFPEPTAKKYLEFNKTLIDSGGRREYEDVFVLNGKEKTFFIIDQCLKDENGCNYALQSSSIDITERKQTEEALRASEARFRMIFENSLTGVLVTNPDGEIYAANPEACRMLGHTEAEICRIGRFGIIDNTNPNLSTALEERLRTNHFKGELTFICADGTVFPTDVESGIFTDSAGQKHAYIFFQDITNRKQAEEALLKSKLQFDNLVEKIPVGVYILRSKPDESFTLDYVSPRMAEMLSLTCDGLMADANLVIQSIHPDDRDSFAKMNLEGIQLKKPFDWKGRILTNGTVKWMHFRSTPEMAGNGEMVWHGLVVDITEHINADLKIQHINEELSKAIAVKDKFFSIIAHDLRSPFNIFLGFTEMMVENLPSMTLAQIQEIAFSMRSSANNLYQLLENLLEWSMLQRGINSVNPKSFALSAKITQSLQTVFELANKKEIDLSFTIPEEIEVLADENMFQSIIRNITINAVKFTPKGGNIKVSARLTTDNRIEISVADTGIGMSKELISKLFSLDERTSRKGTDGEPSTGLGLTICKDFVDKHECKIWAESEKGKGSTFYFTLPLGI